MIEQLRPFGDIGRRSPALRDCSTLHRASSQLPSLHAQPVLHLIECLSLSLSDCARVLDAVDKEAAMPGRAEHCALSFVDDELPAAQLQRDWQQVR
jgi:hypothetical protein